MALDGAFLSMVKKELEPLVSVRMVWNVFCTSISRL